MHISQLLRLAKAIRNEGDSVIAQFQAVLDGEDFSEQNPNALKAILPILDRAHALGVDGAEDLADEIRDHLKEQV